MFQLRVWCPGVKVGALLNLMVGLWFLVMLELGILFFLTGIVALTVYCLYHGTCRNARATAGLRAEEYMDNSSVSGAT